MVSPVQVLMVKYTPHLFLSNLQLHFSSGENNTQFHVEVAFVGTLFILLTIVD